MLKLLLRNSFLISQPENLPNIHQVMPFPKIPNVENVNQSMHVIVESIKKTHEGESSRKSPKTKGKVNFASEVRIISNLEGVFGKNVENILIFVGVEDHSLDVLSNVVSFGLLDNSEVIADSIESYDLLENNFDPSENPDEFESEMQTFENSRDSSENSNNSTHASDSSEDNVPIARLNTKGKKNISDTNGSPFKNVDDEKANNGWRLGRGSCWFV
ncbi:unnamed protein product [Citrullus colocynthis]|uniref:Uncharacterized protein n=1 Tax=Citrullus colocynthis TaxID=252529 RepID=A0ABP0Z9J3_9ROSI